MAPEPQRSCETCGAGLDGAQHYCLNCGARVGSRSPQLAELKRRAGDERGQTPPAVTVTQIEPFRPRVSPRMPRPRMAGALVLVFLGFGVLLGSAAGSTRGRLAASVSPRLKFVMPASSPTKGLGVSATGAAAEAPESEAEATPEPASLTPTTPTAKPAGEEGSSAPPQSEPGAGGTTKSGATTTATKLPSFKHVFLIVLDDEPYAADFGPESKARYLASTLEKKGELLVRYDAVAHEQLADGIALVSGQGPTPQTASNCATYSALAATGVGADGQVLGQGCVYPSSTETVGGQLAGKKLKWRAYVEGIDEAGATAGACAHPAMGAADGTAESGAYATFRDPFVYFESVTSSSSCATEIVGLSALKGDLAAASSTPSLSYIVPDRCQDASPTPCSAGAAAGPADADGFLDSVVPEIMASKAYKSAGLIVITSDEAPSSGEFADSSSCCGQPSYPNLSSVEGLGKGGGAVGALLLSPYVPSGKTSADAYNHYSLLRTIEEVFKLGRLGYAGLSGVKPLAPALFLDRAKG